MPRPRRLAIHLVWQPACGRRRRLALAAHPLGWLAGFVLAAAAALVAAQNPWRRQMTMLAVATVPHLSVSSATLVSGGKAVGEPDPDLITPLNVRDPTALVMSPFVSETPVKAESEPPPPVPGSRKKAKDATWRDPKNFRF